MDGPRKISDQEALDFNLTVKLGRMKLEESAFIVAKILDNDVNGNADKTLSKRGFSALCLRRRNHVWPELEAWKNEN